MSYKQPLLLMFPMRGPLEASEYILMISFSLKSQPSCEYFMGNGCIEDRSPCLFQLEKIDFLGVFFG